MSEIIDLYDNARRFVTTAKRRAPIPDGLNKLSVHVWFVNSHGQFLLQQRLPTSKKFPNMWGQTGGGAIAGESGWDCCVRESTEDGWDNSCISHSKRQGDRMQRYRTTRLRED